MQPAYDRIAGCITINRSFGRLINRLIAINRLRQIDRLMIMLFKIAKQHGKIAYLG
jgi:hypothetical protein